MGNTTEVNSGSDRGNRISKIPKLFSDINKMILNYINYERKRILLKKSERIRINYKNLIFLETYINKNNR